nr:ATP-binding protein [Oleiagrimonas sp. C23AA]
MSTLRPVLDAAPDAMLIVDQEGLIRCFNLPARELLGYGEDIEGQPVERLVPEQRAQAHRRHRQEYARAPHRRPMGSGLRLWARHADGHELPVEISLSPVRIDGQACVIASIRDASLQHRAQDIQVRLQSQETLISLWEQALREDSLESCTRDAVRALHELFSASRIRLYEIDDETLPVRLRAIRDTLDQAPAQWQEISAEPDVAALFNDEMHALEQGLPPVAARLHQHADEALLMMSLRYQRKMVGALCISLPSRTLFTRDQVYLAQSVTHLLAGVFARRRADQLLLLASKMEALGQLSGGVAHDFNNLLNIISGNLEILGDRLSERADCLQLIDTALRATRRGGELTKRLLMFARKRPPRVQTQAIEPLVEDIVPMLQRMVGKRIDIRLDMTPGLPAVSVDPTVLDACLVNLTTNARDAMPDGGIVDIRLRDATISERPAHQASSTFQGGRFVVVEVVDTGYGMNHETARRAFEPFFSTKPAGEGTGLGLSLASSLITQIGGYIALESIPDDGTRVTLYIPVATQVMATAPAHEDHREAIGHGECILIVEDDAAVRDTAQAMTESLDYRVLTAGSVPEALQQLHEHQDIALVLSDILIGREGNGLDLRQALRRTYPHIPVLFTSGYARPALQRHGIQAEQIDLLAKPYTRAQLGAALRKAIGPSGH